MKFTYRVGLPGWKVAARLGAPLSVRVEVMRDHEAEVYWARSPDLDGLVIEGKTLDELLQEARGGIETLLELQLHGHRAVARPRLQLTDDALCIA